MNDVAHAPPQSTRSAALQQALDATAANAPTILHALSRAGTGAEIGITLLPDDEAEGCIHRSYADLGDAVHRRAAQLQALGIEPGERVLLVLPTSFEFIEAFFGLMLIGAIPVPAYPPAALSGASLALARLRHMIADAGIRICLTNQRLAPLMASLAVGRAAVSRVVAVERLPAARPGALAPSLSSTAFFQYTSGSTSHPRGVVVSHAALLANIEAAGRASSVTEADRMVSWLPLYHDMGIVGGMMWPLYWRIPLVLMSPLAFMVDPRRWLEAISDFKGTIAMGPNFAYARCAARVKDVEGLDLSHLRIALNGAEPVSATTSRAFYERFAPAGLGAQVMYPCYGLAESVVAVTFSEPSSQLIVDRVDRALLAEGRAAVREEEAEGSIEIVAVGKAIPGHEVRIVGPQGETLPDRHIGEVRVKGPSLMDGYHQNPAATGEVLRDGWLCTGDLGYLVDGYLFITGRAKDLIIVRGRNYHAEDIEGTVERVDGVRPGRVVAFGVYDEASASDQLIVVVEDGPRKPAAQVALEDAIRRSVGEVIGLRVHDIVFVPKGSIGRTPSGKRQRLRTRLRYQRKTLGRREAGVKRVVATAALGRVGLWLRRRLRR
jgi:acyl-CoA synthetase (AMP-forming)/AMP-acid ligase II